MSVAADLSPRKGYFAFKTVQLDIKVKNYVTDVTKFGIGQQRLLEDIIFLSGC